MKIPLHIDKVSRQKYSKKTKTNKLEYFVLLYKLNAYNIQVFQKTLNFGYAIFAASFLLREMSLQARIQDFGQGGGGKI